MYAMDHTMHFEHRTTDAADQRASRWNLRRLVTTQPAQATQPAPTADIDSNPVHGFLD